VGWRHRTDAIASGLPRFALQGCGDTDRRVHGRVRKDAERVRQGGGPGGGIWPSAFEVHRVGGMPLVSHRAPKHARVPLYVSGGDVAIEGSTEMVGAHESLSFLHSRRSQEATLSRYGAPYARDGGRPAAHFNERDQGAGVPLDLRDELVPPTQIWYSVQMTEKTRFAPSGAMDCPPNASPGSTTGDQSLPCSNML